MQEEGGGEGRKRLRGFGRRKLGENERKKGKIYKEEEKEEK